MMYLSGARHSRAPEDRLQKMTARKSIFQDITQVIVIKQTIEHDF